LYAVAEDAVAAWNARPGEDAALARAEAAEARGAELEAALRKINGAAFNDNGDVTYDTGAMQKAYFIARAALKETEK
jgi:hypothetical protein